MEQYLDLLKTIKEKGTYKPAARENMPGTQSLFGYQFRHDLADGFPLLTTKKMYWKGVVTELLWFLRGDTNVKYLIDNGVNIWNEDAYNYYIKIALKHENDPAVNAIYQGVSNEKGERYPADPNDVDAYSMFTFEEFCDILKSNTLTLPSYRRYTLGDCGYQYGKVWRDWGDEHVDQIANLIEGLKNSPQSRRHVVTAWDPAHDKDLALTWCHALFQFNCRPLTAIQREDYFAKSNDYSEEQRYGMHPNHSDEDVHSSMDEEKVPRYYLDCQLYQRSADVVLGVPFNIASYALLTHVLARMCNMVPGEYIHTFGDVHIYDNHRDAVEEQLTRTPTKLPVLEMTLNPGHFAIKRNDYNFSDIEPHDFYVVDYEPQPAIKAELSTGLIK